MSDDFANVRRAGFDVGVPAADLDEAEVAREFEE